MFCPSCFSREMRVLDSRPDFEANHIRRKRICSMCNFRFSTIEVIETGMPKVIKKTGLLEPFEVEKVRRGILKAIEKREVSVDQLDQLVARVLHRVSSSQSKALHAKQVGYIIIDELKDIDLVAMIRFAAVYHSFNDVESFKVFIDEILSNSDEKSEI